MNISTKVEENNASFIQVWQAYASQSVGGDINISVTHTPKIPLHYADLPEKNRTIRDQYTLFIFFNLLAFY